MSDILTGWHRECIERGATLLVVPEEPSEPPHSCRYVMNEAKTHALCVFDSPDHPGGIGFCPPTPESVDHRLPSPIVPGDVLEVGEHKLRCTDVGCKRLGQMTDEDAIKAGAKYRRGNINAYGAEVLESPAEWLARYVCAFAPGHQDGYVWLIHVEREGE